MDQFNEPVFFLINIILIVVYGTIFFGIKALIAFGLIAAPIGLAAVIGLFISAAVSSA